VCIRTETKEGRFSMLHGISLYAPISHHHVTLTLYSPDFKAVVDEWVAGRSI
jgi:hypothetical protein